MSTPKTAQIIYLNAVWAQVQGLTARELKLIGEAYRFRKPGWDYSKAAKAGWDGYTLFFSDKTGKFLAGLVPEMEHTLDQLGYVPEIFRVEGESDRFVFNESIINPNLVEFRKKDVVSPLRDHQLELIWKVVDNQRGVVQAPTGAGKTGVAAGVLKIINEAPALVVFRSVDLLHQSEREYIELGVPEHLVGVFYAGMQRPGRFTLTTVQSLHYVEPILPLVKVLITDECHYGFTTPSCVKYLKAMKNAQVRIAFSATPWKKRDQVHNYKLMGHFGSQLGQIKTKDLQGKGFLSDCKTFYVDVNEPSFTLQGLDYINAYRSLIVENAWFHDKVAETVKRCCKGRTLILVEWKDHGMALNELIPNSYWVNGDDSKAYRGELREKLRSATEDITVISTSIFGTGLDLYLHNLINCSGGRSDIQQLQKYGRTLRNASDKHHGVFVDFFHHTDKHLESHSAERRRTLKKEGHQIVDCTTFEQLWEHLQQQEPRKK